MAWEFHSEKEMIIGKVIFEISRKNDVHNNYETDYSYILRQGTAETLTQRVMTRLIDVRLYHT